MTSNAIAPFITGGLVAWLALLPPVTLAGNGTPVAVAAATPGCSNKTLKGRWGVDLQGTLLDVMPGPVAIVGVLTSTGDGTFTGTGVTNFNGSIKSHVTYTGTYAVGPDCAGTGTLAWPTMGIRLDIYFVITGTGNAQEIWFTNTALPAIVHGRAKKMAR